MQCNHCWEFCGKFAAKSVKFATGNMVAKDRPGPGGKHATTLEQSEEKLLAYYDHEMDINVEAHLCLFQWTLREITQVVNRLPRSRTKPNMATHVAQKL